MLAEPAAIDKAEVLENPTRVAIAKEQALINQIYEPELLLRVEKARSKIVHTNFPIARSAISNPDIVDIQVFDANELEIVGKQVGETTITFWFDIPNQGREVLRYLVQVDDVKQEQRRREARYKALQSRINELFPGSQVFLFPVENKVIVRGQARDAKEADEIIRLLGQRNSLNDSTVGRSAPPGFGAGNTDGNQSFESDGDIFVNLLTVPGEQQVMLKVRVAELVRNSGRNAGVDINISDANLQLSSILGGAGNITAIFDDGDVQFFLEAISSHSYGKILAEPTLVTISGQPAQFLSGGEFAVPTAVGVGGVGAATTTFRGFGTQLQFTPTVLDKDLIRLQVSPSFSSLNAAASVDGIPGLSTRSLNTTVDLREGQWLAVAGLIQDESGGQRTRVPYLGDLPFVGGLFSTMSTSRFETELVVLVSPELIHPLEAEQVPLLLPGMEITEPTDDDFFLRNNTEGYQGFDHRSTVWPEVKRQNSGVRQHGYLQRVTRQIGLQKAYVCGPSGFSQ